MEKWINVKRPGYFGRRRDERIEEYNSKYGKENWRLTWIFDNHNYNFEDACSFLYEFSYYKYLINHPDDLKFITTFGECIDNAPTNIQSGCDYNKQEAFSTHIQDIAIRNVLRHLGMKFRGESDNILVIRTTDSNGYKFNPGNIPFFQPELIIQPSLAPGWAKLESVEDFWQSNKWLQVRDGSSQTDLLSE